MSPDSSDLVVGVVGPCSAGKSTLVRALQARGYAARHIAQEHSFVPHMWQTVARPDVLIYLDVSYPVAQQRRWMDWQPADLAEQRRRLEHARAHCHLYLATDDLSIETVRERALDFLASHSRHPPGGEV
jgi:thymidylate kinase